MSPWWKKPDPVEPTVVEQIEAIEVPIITEVKARLAKGDYAGALRVSYPVAANDLAKAFQKTFPPGMTHEEFLRTRTTKEMGHLPEFFRRFYGLYAPLRYGPPGPVHDTGALTGILESIYANKAMWYLYLQSTEEGVVKVRTPEETAPASVPPSSEELP